MSDQAESTPPVIFLDIDGVLNRTRHATHIRVDDDLVDRLRTLVRRTGSCLVLSTFWRHFRDYISYVLHRHGIDSDLVIGSTPGRGHAGGRNGTTKDREEATTRSMLGRSAFDESEYESRHDEIEAWLADHPEVGDRYIILDDRPSAARPGTVLAERFVKIATEKGLTDDDVEVAVALLERTKKPV